LKLGHPAEGVVIVPGLDGLSSIRQLPDASQMITSVIERRAITIHEPLAVIPLQHDPASYISLLDNIISFIPEILVVACDLQGLGGVRIQLADLDSSAHPVISELRSVSCRRNRDRDEPVFRI